MAKKQVKQRVPMIHCDACGVDTLPYESVRYGADASARSLCMACFNAEVARNHGLTDFDHIKFEPIVMTDFANLDHEFHFNTMLLGPMVALEAYEIKRGSRGGYQFQIIGKPEDDLMALLGRLIERMRRSLAIQHLKLGDLGLQIADRAVRGRIESDEIPFEHAPLLVIDGQDVSWEEFGQMLLSFEGWQFKLEIRDRSEDN